MTNDAPGGLGETSVRVPRNAGPRHLPASVTDQFLSPVRGTLARLGLAGCTATLEGRGLVGEATTKVKRGRLVCNIKPVDLGGMVDNLVTKLLALFDARAAAAVTDQQPTTGGVRARRPARAASTRRHLAVRWTTYLDWCVLTGATPTPASAGQMRDYAGALMLRPVLRGKNKGRVGLAPTSIMNNLYSVETMHRLLGVNLPDLGPAAAAVEEYAAGRAADPTLTDGQPAPHLRRPGLAEVFAIIPLDTHAGIRDRALLSLGSALMAGCGDLSRLNVEDVGEPTAEGLPIRVKAARPGQKDTTVLVAHRPDLGPMNPVPCILGWKTLLNGLGVVSGPFLRGVDKDQKIHGVHQGWGGYGDIRLLPYTVERVIIRWAVRANIAQAGEFTAQSLKSGGIADAYELDGKDLLEISQHARYAPGTTTMFRYIDSAARPE